MFDAIGFDADDTLWENEIFFFNAQRKLNEVLKNYTNSPQNELLKTEKKNLQKYGYGVKGFILSLIETSLKLSNGKIENKYIEEFINWKTEEENKVAALVAGSKLAEMHLSQIIETCCNDDSKDRFDPTRNAELKLAIINARK